MMFLKKYKYILITLILLLSAIFLIIIYNPQVDLDTWYHIKAGEIIAKQGILHYDVFSHAAHGREWYPYEWLFQVILYLIQTLFGFAAIKYFTATIAILYIGLLYFFLLKLFNLKHWSALLLCFSFFTVTYEVFTARPQLLSTLFFIINFFAVLLYYLKDKNILWITFPITLLWTNMHGSIILNIFVFASYTTIAAVNYYLSRQTVWLTKAKTLGASTVLTIILTILPPLGFTQYRLLYLFFINQTLLSNFIIEWKPLLNFPSLSLLYTGYFVVIFLIIVIYSLRKHKVISILWMLPLLAFIMLPYLAYRNSVYGYYSLAVLSAWILSQTAWVQKYSIKKVFLIVGVSTYLILLSFILYEKWLPSKTYYPTQAVIFLQKYLLNGNMFNEFTYGGYLIYHLYPQKVFIDLRADVYLCCEILSYQTLSKQSSLPDTQYQQLLNTFWQKYDISYVLLDTKKNTFQAKIARLLLSDSQWSLVFWDDTAQIFIRKDGKNTNIIKQFGAYAVTPYGNDSQYRKDSMAQALQEYQRMITIADSARSENAIGIIYWQLKKYDLAKTAFEKAIKLDNSFESPYVNLAVIAQNNGDYTEAFSLYKKALSLAPDRASIYIRLGNLYINTFHDTESAQKIWQKGLENVIRQSDKEELQNLLQHSYIQQ